MPRQVTESVRKDPPLEAWFAHADFAAAFVVLAGLLARLRNAYGTFLNPDEALHFRLANQTSLLLAYKQSLTAAHPPLLVVLLYFWRDLGTSELWLRLPSVIAGTIFCWALYKWLAQADGRLTGFIAVVLVSLLPPIVGLTAEIRQYALLLAFLAYTVYFLDRAFAEKSTRLMVLSSFFLYLSMSVHYSAFLFAIALGIYGLWRIFAERPPSNLISAWGFGQALGVGLAALLYKVQLSHLGIGDSRTVARGFISDFFLRRSYYDPAHDNPLWFVGHSFGVFQYFFGQLAVGDVCGALFLVGVGSLLRHRGMTKKGALWVALQLALPFVVACIASFFHVYPYGGTRELAFLVMPAVGGVSVALAQMAGGNWVRGVALCLLLLVLCLIFGKPRQPRMDRADQSRGQMAAAMEYLRRNVPPASLIFVDYQTDLILGHYLCRQLPIVGDDSLPGFESFSCGGYRVVSANYKTWMYSDSNFVTEWNWMVRTYRPPPGEKVWNFQCGWGIKLADELRSEFPEFRDLQVASFGSNIQIFPLTVGQPMPHESRP